jgi:glutamate/tyrosine decarboxylase-like PLP-dependent enzyme
MTPDQQQQGGAKPELTSEQIEREGSSFGNRFLLEPAPDNALPKTGMPAQDAMRLVGEEILLDGLPMRNLATFVTTWMEPEATRLITDALHTNFIDHAEYPQTAEIEQRCIRMIADLFNAPGETTGARTQGSSEAIMLGALSLKWKWRARREAAGKSTDRPNLVLGEVLSLFRRRAAHRPAGEGQVHDRPRGRGGAHRREHDRCRRGAGNDLHRALR